MSCDLSSIPLHLKPQPSVSRIVEETKTPHYPDTSNRMNPITLHSPKHTYIEIVTIHYRTFPFALLFPAIEQSTILIRSSETIPRKYSTVNAKLHNRISTRLFPHSLKTARVCALNDGGGFSPSGYPLDLVKPSLECGAFDSFHQSRHNRRV